MNILDNLMRDISVATKIALNDYLANDNNIPKSAELVFFREACTILYNETCLSHMDNFDVIADRDYLQKWMKKIAKADKENALAGLKMRSKFQENLLTSFLFELICNSGKTYKHAGTVCIPYFSVFNDKGGRHDCITPSGEFCRIITNEHGVVKKLNCF